MKTISFFGAAAFTVFLAVSFINPNAAKVSESSRLLASANIQTNSTKMAAYSSEIILDQWFALIRSFLPPQCPPSCTIIALKPSPRMIAMLGLDRQARLAALDE